MMKKTAGSPPTAKPRLQPGAAVSMEPGRGREVSRGRVVGWAGERVTGDWSEVGYYEEDPEDLTEEAEPCGAV